MDRMNMHDNRLKFSGHHVELPEEYELGANILFKGEGEIIKREQKDTNDGEYIQTHTLRPKLVELIASESVFQSQPTIAVPLSKSRSKQLRDTLFVYWDQQLRNKYPDFEKYYDATMDKIINDVKEKLE